MTEASYDFSCECGYAFRLRDRHPGAQILCPSCNQRLSIPTELQPIEGEVAISNNRDRLMNNDDKRIEWNYLVPGIITLPIVWVVLLAAGYRLWTGFVGPRTIYWPVGAAVMLLMGAGMTLKG